METMGETEELAASAEHKGETGAVDPTAGEEKAVALAAASTVVAAEAALWVALRAADCPEAKKAAAATATAVVDAMEEVVASRA